MILNIFKLSEEWDINLFNKNSIFFTLAISLFVAITLLTISFYTINKMQQTKQYLFQKNKYQTISTIVNQEYARFGFTNDLKYMINDMGLILISSSREIGNILEQETLKLFFKKRSNNILLHIFYNEQDNFLLFQTPFDEFIIIDKDVIFNKHNNILLFGFLFLLSMILLIAYSVYKKLAPLNELTSKIHNIGKKDLKLDFLNKNAKDEVSLLAKTLLEKSVSINKLKTARDVFIRNIMHELKTPITKGRFLVELPESAGNKEKLNTVFYQLESLISEFAVIEEVIAKKENITKKEIFFDDILENSFDILMLEDESKVSLNKNDLKIIVNFKLFTIVIKNLIDNAIKYSNNGKVTIQIENNSISFSNEGKKLEYDLEKYYEPFFSEHTNKKESFGLGLYIIKSILDVHNFKLEYTYQNKKNIFKILL
jgi:two-component system OmpR family sensor kinase